jgi:hypothetical protein
VAARSKAWVCGHSLVGIVGSNPAGSVKSLYILNVVRCQVEISGDRPIPSPKESY